MKTTEAKRVKLKRGGYDMTAITTLDDGSKLARVVYFPMEDITQKDIDTKFAKIEKNIQDDIDEASEPVEVVYTKTEIETLLVEKKYLDPGQTLEDLKVKELTTIDISKEL